MSDDREGIIWLASYPKSGNTWLRVFLDAYHKDAEPDINALFGVFTDQAARWYQACSPDPVATMSDNELGLLRGAAMLNLRNSATVSPVLVKTHTANVRVGGSRMIPPALTKKVVYLIRDPRDVCLSYAKHFGITPHDAVDRMTCDAMAIFDDRELNLEKVRQYPTSWARHVQTYAEAEDLDVTVVKYEDLKANPTEQFGWILDWIGVPSDDDRIKRAVENSALAKLRAAEDRTGFRECSHKADRFFGQGMTGGWRDVMDEEDVAKLEAHACHVMDAFGYKLATRAAA